jgi:hypothetical protein
MTPESRNSGRRGDVSFLGNGSVNSFPRQRPTMEVLMETVFSVGSAPRLYKEDTTSVEIISRMETESNTSAVALRVVGGDEKGTQCRGV